MSIPIGSILRTAGRHIVGGLTDPKTGHVSVSRTGTVSMLGILAVHVAAGGDWPTTLILATGSVGMAYVRTRTTDCDVPGRDVPETDVE